MFDFNVPDLLGISIPKPLKIIQFQVTCHYLQNLDAEERERLFDKAREVVKCYEKSNSAKIGKVSDLDILDGSEAALAWLNDLQDCLKGD